MTRSLAATFTAALLVLSACGDDDDATEDADGVEASTSIEATATEFEFSPDSWTVPAARSSRSS